MNASCHAPPSSPGDGSSAAARAASAMLDAVTYRPERSACAPFRRCRRRRRASARACGVRHRQTAHGIDECRLGTADDEVARAGRFAGPRTTAEDSSASEWATRPSSTRPRATRFGRSLRADRRSPDRARRRPAAATMIPLVATRHVPRAPRTSVPGGATGARSTRSPARPVAAPRRRHRRRRRAPRTPQAARTVPARPVPRGAAGRPVLDRGRPGRRAHRLR